ncbi:MAG: hypothetical protein ACXVCP_20325, partial [Bdellovibrio sp.]
YLLIASQLKGTAVKPDSVDESIKKALLLRSDRASLNLQNLKLFPEISLDAVQNINSCQGVFAK